MAFSTVGVLELSVVMSPMPPSLLARLTTLVTGLTSHLWVHWSTAERFPEPNNYASSWFALALAHRDTADPRLGAVMSRLKEELQRDTHPEFNTFALRTLRAECPEVAALVPTYNEASEANATNWRIMRALNSGAPLSEKAVLIILREAQDSSGFIADGPYDRSTQYHFASTAFLVGSATDDGQSVELRTRIHAAVRCARALVLRAGYTAAVGRGQQQLFGYAAAIFALTRFGYYPEAERLSKYLAALQTPSGALPLVCAPNAVPVLDPVNVDEERFAGWYRYNSHWDYSAFAAAMLARALSCEAPAARDSQGPTDIRVARRTFRIVRRKAYDAVVSTVAGGRTGRGRLVNDCPMPFVVDDVDRVTTSFGGEESDSSLYSNWGVPLPLVSVGRSLSPLRQHRVWSRWMGENRLVILSRFGFLVRNFRFLPTAIEISDVHLMTARTFGYVVLPSEWRQTGPSEVQARWLLQTSHPLLPVETHEFAWSGRLRAYRTARPTAVFKARLCPR